ncbi:MAG: TonB-dependent receptor, partial [Acidobacteriota bacterium]|nr:TonB-dependent receptor [Acidobacteriota bacterium]
MKSLACFFLSSFYLFAQLDLGSIDGTVTDGSGAVVAGAEVQIRNPDTDFTQDLVTNAQGLYSAPLLRPGNYQLIVEAPGFRRTVRNGIVLQVQDKLKIDFQLQVGQATESVEVTAEAPLLQSESASTGQVIDSQKITELPLNGRDWLRLGRLAPGVVSTYYARDRSFTANGMRSIQNSYLIDGVSNVSNMRGLDDRRRDVIRPSPDALEEFKVQTTLFSAEYGQAAGAVINATMKSGTNRFHGSLFEFGRNAAFDATPYFQPAGTAKPGFNQHQFGGTFGGPIKRDRLFFFFNYEGLREANSSPQVATVPTLAMRNGDFSGSPTIYDPRTLTVVNGVSTRTPFTGNQVPMDRWDPIAKALLTNYPLPNQPGVRNFVYNPGARTTSDQINTRVDYRFGNNDQIFGRYNQLDSPVVNPAVLPPPANLPVTVPDKTRGIAGSWIHNFGPTLINELRYGFNRIQSSQSTGTDVNNYGIANSLAPGVQGPPVINITGLNSLGAQGNIPIQKLSETHEILDNITKVTGRHTLKAGVDFRLISPFTNSTLNGKAALTFNGAFTQLPSARGTTGAPFADFLLGLAQTANVGSRIVADEQGKVYAAYFQDDWKLTPTLTLNLGIRYEIATPYVEANNHQANFVYAPNSPLYGTLAIAGMNGNSRGLINTDTNNVAPRFGFAWQAMKHTVIRGGFGIFYGQDEGYGVVARMVGNPPFFGSVTYPSDQLNPLITLSGGFPANATDPKNLLNPAAVAYPVNS